MSFQRRFASNDRQVLPQQTQERANTTTGGVPAYLKMVALLAFVATSYLVLVGGNRGGQSAARTAASDAPAKPKEQLVQRTDLPKPDLPAMKQDPFQDTELCKKVCLKSDSAALTKHSGEFSRTQMMETHGDEHREVTDWPTYMHNELGVNGYFIWYHSEGAKARWLIGDDVGEKQGLAFIDSFARTPCEIARKSARAKWFVNVGSAEDPDFLHDKSLSLLCDGEPQVERLDPIIRAQHVSLSNGINMPLLGARIHGSSAESRETMLAAKAGYTLFDTASDYVRTGRERMLAQQFAEGTLTRDDVWITTKLHSDNHGFDETLVAAQRSLTALGTTYIDLYMIDGFKCTKSDGKCGGTWKDSWRALEKLYADNVVRALGVTGVDESEMEQLLAWSSSDIHVAQGVYHPFQQDRLLRDKCKKYGIHYQGHGLLAPPSKALNDPVINTIAVRLGRTNAQVTLRWALQTGVSAVFRSQSKKELEDIMEVYDFSLSDEDMDKLNALG